MQAISKICGRCKRTIYPDKTKALPYFRSCCDQCFVAWEKPTGELTQATKSQELAIKPYNATWLNRTTSL